MKSVGREFNYGNHKVILETGRIARQATGAALVTMGDTVVLCTVVGAANAKPSSFFPLTVNYQEKAYAAGRIPGSFFRREGRPSEQEILTSRLIDRSIRPLAVKGFMNEVQVICTVMSADSEVTPDVPALLGTAAALSLSGLPFDGPLAAARVGFKDNLYLLNPTYTDLAQSALDMMVASTKDAVLMVESEANELSEDLMLGGILFAHKEIRIAIDAITSLTEEAGKARWAHRVPEQDEAQVTRVKAGYEASIKEACGVEDKAGRQAALQSLKTEAQAQLATEGDNEQQSQIASIFNGLQKEIIRDRILQKAPRMDGRDAETVRPIDIEIGLLPKAHGSALFTRGETQSIATATLGPQKDAALIDALTGTYKEGFLLHYNFPPYSVGETSFLGGPKRREIGHGHLARRAVMRMLPEAEDFPYTIRIVSEITESNGSSSMATVCSASLALMDAGIPIKAPVAGVAMGLVLEGERFAVLTDIMGDEDHLGDMDFKVAGTSVGITALQMDIKVHGITGEIMEQALTQAKTARMHILGKMNAVLPESRAALSENAPAFKIIQVPTDKIRNIIGKGGITIRSITSETGASIDINDDGKVTIYGETGAILAEAIRRIEELTTEPEVGVVYQGEVKNITGFGAFVEILPGKQGLLHVSQITGERIENVSDYLTEGEKIRVLVSEIDGQDRIKLSMKDVDNAGEQQLPEDVDMGMPETSMEDTAVSEENNQFERAVPQDQPVPEVGKIYHGSVKHLEHYGGFVEILPGVQGLVHKSEIKDDWIENASDHLQVDQEVDVLVTAVTHEEGRMKIALSIKKAAEQDQDQDQDPL